MEVAVAAVAAGGRFPDVACQRCPARQETLEVGGVQRNYIIVVPASVDGRTPAPVILGFHGGQRHCEAASQYG